MLKRFATAAALVGAFSGIALAGYKTSQPVVVSTTGLYAFGYLGTARNSTTDTLQYIGCEVSTQPGSSTGYCFAKDAAGHQMSCQTTDSAMIATIRSVNGDSSVIFDVNTSGTCSSLEVANYSMYEPKQP